MPRFFVNASSVTDTEITILGDDARHIARSLRMAVGDSIVACDGSGIEYLCTLTKIRDDACSAKIISKAESSSEPPCDITLFMAYPKGDKLEVVIQKSVELGVKKIIPFQSSRCIKKPDKDKADSRGARLSKIAEEAAKQCGRAVIPTVEKPVSFNEMIELSKSFDLPIFCYEGNGAASLKKILKEAGSPKKICVIVGSEGGFSEEEANIARCAGLSIANLGKRILRCETAPLFVLSAICYHTEL